MKLCGVKKIGLAFVFLALIAPGLTQAQNQNSDDQSYYYDRIDAEFDIHPDSTVQVTEKITFSFTGNFHSAWRDISLDGISAISNITVMDGVTFLPLTYSKKRLDKLDEASWGKYTTWVEGGKANVEWYYNLTDTKYTWIINYTVHGAIGFGKTQDRFYWDVFTDYDKPINLATSAINFPQPFPSDKITAVAYITSRPNLIGNYSGTIITADFAVYNLAAYDDFTIDIGFPAGIVSPAAFWRDWISLKWGLIVLFFMIIFTPLVIIFRWYTTEVKPKGRGTIIPQYEPPQKLKPAMAEIVCKEKLTNQGLAATVVHLAIRGYIKIEDDTPAWLLKPNAKKIVSLAMVIGVVVILFPFTASIFYAFQDSSFMLFPSSKSLALGFAPIVFAIILLFNGVIFGAMGKAKNFGMHYRLVKLQGNENGSGLEDYEKKYMDILFKTGGVFSTRELKKSSTDIKQQMFEEISELKKDILNETEVDTNAFSILPSKETRAYSMGVIVVFILLAISLLVLGKNIYQPNQFYTAIFSILIALFIIWLFFKYEARLSPGGRILKEDWLGFKMYLETAERYRLQNLTPETFERFLPYAMVFGIEDKWTKAFTAMHLPQPNWYAVSAGLGMTGGGGFSASTFSASFSSSFMSALGSSGGGGGAGGGSAGGGGGGAGGGAG